MPNNDTTTHSPTLTAPLPHHDTTPNKDTTTSNDTTPHHYTINPLVAPPIHKINAPHKTTRPLLTPKKYRFKPSPANKRRYKRFSKRFSAGKETRWNNYFKRVCLSYLPDDHPLKQNIIPTSTVRLKPKHSPLLRPSLTYRTITTRLPPPIAISPPHQIQRPIHSLHYKDLEENLPPQ